MFLSYLGDCNFRVGGTTLPRYTRARTLPATSLYLPIIGSNSSSNFRFNSLKVCAEGLSPPPHPQGIWLRVSMREGGGDNYRILHIKSCSHFSKTFKSFEPLPPFCFMFFGSPCIKYLIEHLTYEYCPRLRRIAILQ